MKTKINLNLYHYYFDPITDKSKIKMDKHKLIRIIAKDLEELKTLNDEIEAVEEGSLPIVDLALSRAKLLCQELELLKSFSKPAISLNEEIENDESEEEEDELSDQDFPEPELEILHFEEHDFSDSDDLTKEEEEEQVVYDSDDEEMEEEIEEDSDKENEPVSEDLPDFGEPLKEDISEEDEEEEEEIAPIEEHELDVENEDQEINEIDDEEEEEVKHEQPTVRQIEIEELDDEDEDSVEFSPVSNPVSRPVMREIPKPEPVSPKINFPEEKEEEKKPAEPGFQKDRSLNETIGEKKEAETNLSNTPITSLRAAIGLNDRFLFIREIFNNNSEKYNTIIDQLDKMETIQQAVDYLKVNLSLQKNETSMKFVDLLKRRFTK
jgi:hypothetical protein